MPLETACCRASAGEVARANKAFSRPFSRPLPPSVAKSSHSLLSRCHLYDAPHEGSKKAKHSPTSVPVQATCADTSVPFDRDGTTASPLAEAEFFREKAAHFQELDAFKQGERKKTSPRHAADRRLSPLACPLCCTARTCPSTVAFTASLSTLLSRAIHKRRQATRSSVIHSLSFVIAECTSS